MRQWPHTGWAIRAAPTANRQVGAEAVHGPRGAAPCGVFSHHAHNAGQPGPAAIGGKLIQDAVGTAHDRAGTTLMPPVRPFHADNPLMDRGGVAHPIQVGEGLVSNS